MMVASPTSRRPGRGGMSNAPDVGALLDSMQGLGDERDVSEPITAPERLVIPPITSIASVVNVSAR